jgi:hypothetical protein
MQVSEAKDFLVQQTAEQAALDHVSLSDLEKRMMHFTEGPDAIEDAATLNAEFEAANDAGDYEDKISKLLHRAYSRLKAGKSDKIPVWDEAIKVLQAGDHYLLVMW